MACKRSAVRSRYPPPISRSLSSRGLGHDPFTVGTGVRIPVGTPQSRKNSDIIRTLSWGISSAGRALAWHARGQRFDSAILHQKSTVLRLKYGAFLFAFLEVTLKISQMPDFAGAWTATPNSCCFVVFENACSMPDCFAGRRITPPQCKE